MANCVTSDFYMCNCAKLDIKLFDKSIIIFQKSVFSVHWVKQIKKRSRCLISCSFPIYNIFAKILPSTLQCISLINDLWTYLFVKYLNIPKTFHVNINDLPGGNYIPKLYPTYEILLKMFPNFFLKKCIFNKAFLC